jgi:hypothetical protein
MLPILPPMLSLADVAGKKSGLAQASPDKAHCNKGRGRATVVARRTHAEIARKQKSVNPAYL